MDAEELSVKITGDASGLKDAFDNAIKVSGSFGEAIDVVKNALMGPAGLALAIGAVVKISEECIKEWADDEKALLRFNAALNSSPLLDSGAKDQLRAFAEEFATLSGETIASSESMLTMLASTGRTKDEIKKMMDAALALSNATGIDLNTALTQLDATFSGTTGRLSRLTPELKNLSKEELENGAAVDVILQKYGDMDKALAQSTDVSIKNYKNAWSEVKGAMGQVVEQGVRPLRDGMTNMLKEVLDPTSGINKFAERFNAVVEVGKQVALSAIGRGDIFKASADAADVFSGKLDHLQVQLLTAIQLGGQASDVAMHRASEAARAAKTLADMAEADAKAKAESAKTAAAAEMQAADETANFDFRIASLRGAAWDKYFADRGKDEQAAAALALSLEQQQFDRQGAIEGQRYAAAYQAYTTAQDTLTAKSKAADAARYTAAYTAYTTAQDSLTAKAQDAENARYQAQYDKWLKEKKLADDTAAKWVSVYQTIASGAQPVFEALGTALVKQGASWNDVGKAAVHAIAGIVKALGDELAAMAAKKLVKAENTAVIAI